MRKNSIILIIATIFLVACKQRPSESLNLEEVEIANIQISAETMMDIIQSIASPMEVGSLIKSLEIPFSTEDLPDPENLSATTNPLEMAYRVGMLFTDLGYINMYGETEEAEEFLSSLEHLTTELRIGQFFDLPTLKRMASNESSLDSLIYISINSFNYMGNSLRESNRGNQGALMTIGAWIEGLYMSTQAVARNDNEYLRMMIADQKLVLNDLLLVLNYYNDENLVQQYITELEQIMNLYDQVKIVTVVEDPEAVESEGMLELIQSETSEVQMSDEVLDQITKMAGQVRNAHLSVKDQTK